MLRVTTLCAAAGVAVLALAVSPAQAGYYLIRWDNTGVCQVWSEGFQMKPPRWLSDYKVVSKPIETFTGALDEKEKLRQHGNCNW